MVSPRIFFTGNRNNADPDQNAVAPVRFPMEYFNHRQGMTSVQVHQSVQSQQGHIWSVTPLGLARYDGVSIKMIHQKEFLSTHGLRAIAVDQKGLLWIGSDWGIDILDVSSGYPLKIYSEPIGTVDCIAVGTDLVLVGTTQGLFRSKEGGHLEPTEISELVDATISDILVQEDGEIWFTGPKIGLCIYNYREKHILPMNCAKEIGTPSILEHAPNGQTLIGGDQGIILCAGNSEQIFTIRTKEPVLSLLWDGGRIWAGLSGSLVEFDTNKSQEQIPRILMDGITVLGMFVDNFRNVWLSSDSHALYRVNGIRHLFENPAQNDIGGVFSISGTEDHLLLAGSTGVSLPNGDIVLDGVKVWDAVIDKHNKLWAATQQGLYCSVNSSFCIPYRHDQSEVFAAPCRALMLHHGDIYVASTRGLAKMCANGPIEIRTADNKSMGYVYSLHAGPLGELWIATLGNGLWKMEGNRVSRVLSDHLSKTDNVYALTHAASGDIFVAHNGLISKISTNNECHLLVDTGDAMAAWALGFLETGFVVAGTSSGLVFYNAQSGKRGYYITGGSRDKLSEFTTSRSLKILDQKVILGGTSSGLFSLSIPPVPPGLGKPVAAVSKIEWRNVSPSEIDGKIIVETGHWHLLVSLETCWYLDEYDCSMRFKLNGFDHDWSPSRSIGEIVYTSLPAGQYILDVEMTSPLAGTGPVQTVFEFEVREKAQ